MVSPARAPAASCARGTSRSAWRAPGAAGAARETPTNRCPRTRGRRSPGSARRRPSARRCPSWCWRAGSTGPGARQGDQRLLAMGAIRATLDPGRSVPADVSVVGYDDMPLGASFLPPLSSVR
ncbi:MAG: substrate-binding domain-containing protein [Rhodanobacter sp.]|uniref:substrate-binding domain-containing protein n=1 Tax=Rhodanobacter sp. KK11 TaxID=3083255 RepID=UPI00296606A6|nr:substrate-binding domain-containing protein [Rhodanobacter sp. KK11]MDW2982597.1 substrate-binding domain-containing protein [Rhodanobacter sp. KK11]